MCKAQLLTQETNFSWHIELDLMQGETVHSLVLHPNSNIIYAFGTTPEHQGNKSNLFLARLQEGRILQTYTFGMSDSTEVIHKVGFNAEKECFSIIGSVEGHSFMIDISEKGKVLYQGVIPLRNSFYASSYAQPLIVPKQGCVISGKEQGQAVLAIINDSKQTIYKKVMSSLFFHRGAKIAQLAYLPHTQEIIIAMNGKNYLNKAQSVIACLKYPQKALVPAAINTTPNPAPASNLSNAAQASIQFLYKENDREICAMPELKEKYTYHFPQNQLEESQNLYIHIGGETERAYFTYLFASGYRNDITLFGPTSEFVSYTKVTPHPLSKDAHHFEVNSKEMRYLILLISKDLIPDMEYRLKRLSELHIESSGLHFRRVFRDILIESSDITYEANKASFSWNEDANGAIACLFEL